MSRHLILTTTAAIAGILIVSALLIATTTTGITLPSPTAFIAPGSSGYVLNTTKSLLKFGRSTLFV
jgi:hypothetical protein